MLKQVLWVGSSKADLKRFPDGVQDLLGFAIYQAQTGLRHRDAKPLKGFGSGVLQIAARHGGNAYRAVYTVRLESAVYVLHAFQKKAKRGIATPKKELDVLRRRLRAAEQDHLDVHGGG
ncbi:MAG: addiction module toxin RelE [Gammaproteobacteria bacterium]|nr:addiction module toxin RelE [Gammaproteobacteria bacterium]